MLCALLFTQGPGTGLGSLGCTAGTLSTEPSLQPARGFIADKGKAPSGGILLSLTNVLLKDHFILANLFSLCVSYLHMHFSFAF